MRMVGAEEGGESFEGGDIFVLGEDAGRVRQRSAPVGAQEYLTPQADGHVDPFSQEETSGEMVAPDAPF
jgi:hypothetical protein